MPPFRAAAALARRPCPRATPNVCQMSAALARRQAAGTDEADAIGDAAMGALLGHGSRERCGSRPPYFCSFSFSISA
jgi:hypothetical protein